MKEIFLIFQWPFIYYIQKYITNTFCYCIKHFLSLSNFQNSITWLPLLHTPVSIRFIPAFPPSSPPAHRNCWTWATAAWLCATPAWCVECMRSLHCSWSCWRVSLWQGGPHRTAVNRFALIQLLQVAVAAGAKRISATVASLPRECI